MDIRSGTTMTVPTLRTLSFLAYVFSWGAMWGFATFGPILKMPDGTEDTGLLYVWVVVGFIGSLLIVAKNQRLRDRGLRMRIYLGDLAVLAVGLVLIAVLPATIGLLKGLALWPVFAIHYWWYQRRLAAELSA